MGSGCVTNMSLIMKQIFLILVAIFVAPLLSCAGTVEELIEKNYISPLIKNYPSNELPSQPRKVQLIYESTAGVLKVGNGTSFTSIGGSAYYASAAGIRCNGTDEAAALQTIINTLPSNSRLVIDCAVTIGAAGLQILNKTDVTIDGESRGSITLLARATQNGALSSAKAAVLFDSNARSTIRGLRFLGGGFDHDLLSVTRNTNSLIEDNSFVNGGSTGVVVAFGNTGNRYLRNRVEGSVGTSRGLWIGNISTATAEHYALIEGNIISATGGTGIVMAGDHFRAIGNRSNNSIAGSGLIVSSFDSGGVSTQYVIVANNFLQDNFGSGFQSDCSTAADFVGDVTLTGNLISGNLASGIYLVRTKRWTITGNHIHDNTVAGVTIDNASSIVISGNSIYDSRVGGARTQLKGIGSVASDGNISDVSISGNNIYNNTTLGMQVGANAGKTSANVSMQSNMIRSNSTHGLHVTEVDVGSVTQSIVIGNNVTGNTTSDLRIDPTDVTIEGNIFNTTSGSSPNLYKTFTNLDTTPSVSGRKFFRTNNTAPTTITMFDDGTPGQEITIYFADANTTITDGGNLKLSAAFTSTADDTMQLVFTAGVWYELSRSVN
ncbi:MAG: right-handed parallel beta-helix repeat-containing protein [Actinobacteria bacterium]|nr:MAG: right-handed parallel beta-helix repeat-containing protein [Actinomycetota bacterium]